MTPDDNIRIRHMIEAGELAVTFVEGRHSRDLSTDPMLRLALLHAVQIVGEAASRLSETCKADLPDIPWAVIVGMRHRLVHGYMDIDDEILWTTATDRMPDLLDQLRAIPGLSHR